jgi:membrane-bound serine protease (ClpP class)
MIAALAASPAGGGDFALLLGLAFAAGAVFFFLLELFVPSGGLLALLSALCAIGSVGAFFSHDAIFGAAALAGYAVLAPAAIVFGVRVWAKSPLGRRMILRASESQEDADGDAAARSSTHGDAPADSLASLLGAEGITATPLRPVGFVRIGSRQVDAVADFGVIEANRRIRVVEIRDNAVRVREA